MLLDLVVRDKQGRPVTDLQSGEVEVLEDGSRCEIVSFRLVEAAARRGESDAGRRRDA